MLAAGTTLGPYKILAPLGAGGMGEVYRAHDSRLGRDVAIKVLPSHLAAAPEVRARFEREARTISQLNHPHICTLYDVGHQDGTDYLVMELLEGETLAHRLEKGALPVAEVLLLGRQIAEALDRAHRAGVVHRDLKPGNVMLTKGGAKLMDFGLARAHATGPAAVALTQSPTVTQPLTAAGAIVGTFQYMAPEQLEGKEADARSDLWALGCVLYEMATGLRAFAGESQASLIAAIMTGEPRAMTELQPVTPPSLERVVRRCLAKDPDVRYQSASDLAFDLEGLSAVGGPGTTPEIPGRPTAGRGRFAFAALALVVGAGLVAAIAFMILRAAHVTDASRLKYTRLTVQRGGIRHARFSPDGKTIFYSATWDGHRPEVFETRPGFLQSRALGLPETQLLSICRDGRMTVLLGQVAWWSWGTLAEVPISGGEPRRILDDVWDCDWSPDGKALAVVHRVGDKVRLEMPPGRVLYETSGLMEYPRVSRNGRYVAVLETPFPNDSRGRVVIVDTAGRVICRTQKEWNWMNGVAWAPGDREVWFDASENGAQSEIRAISTRGMERVIGRFLKMIRLRDIGDNGQVLVVQADREVGILGRSSPESEERELRWFDESYAADISRDGRTLLFVEGGAYGGNLYAVCLRGMDGSPPVRLGDGNPLALSPDGKWALTLHFGPPQRLLLLPTGSGDSTAMRRGPIATYFGAGWLPDGKGIVFAGSEVGHLQRTYIQDLAGGLPRAITPEGMAGWRVSPDGRFVAALSRDLRLFVCPVNGDSARLVTGLLPEEKVIQWASDGQSIYVARPGTSMTVSRIAVASGTRSHWRTFSLPDSAGVIVFSTVVTPDGRSYAFTHMRDLTDLYLVEGLK